jgi:hypothetical protein
MRGKVSGNHARREALRSLEMTIMKRSKPIRRESLRRMITGMQKSKAKSVVLMGTTYRLSDISAMFQSSIDAGVDADAKKTAWDVTLAASREKDAQINPLLLAYQGFLLSTSTPDELTEYGLKPRTRVKTKVKDKAKAVDKAIATRAARNTMGKRQKAKVVGVVESDDADDGDDADTSEGASAAAAATPANTSKPATGTN